MRVNLIRDSGQSKEEYQNIPISSQNINEIPDSICTEVCLDNVIDHLTEADFSMVLKKIRHNGMVEIRGVDAPDIFRRVSIGLLAFDNSIPLLASGKVRLTSVGSVKAKLEEHGFVTEVVTIQDSLYYIRAKRP